MKILVTGANGYIGQGVVKNLLDRGHEVIATDLYTDKIPAKAIEIAADIFKDDITFKQFGCPDALLHLVWRSAFSHNNECHITDLPAHYKFLLKMADAGVKQIAVLGSMHEVGFFEGSINENTPTNPLSLYGVAKDALRKISKLICDDKKRIWQWIRGFYIVGNASSGASIFSKIYSADKEGKKEFPFTTGQNQYDFINYEEFCNQIAAVISQDKITGIINACSGKPEKLETRVLQFIRDNNLEIKLKYGVFPDRPYDSKAVWGDNRKITEILANDKN